MDDTATPIESTAADRVIPVADPTDVGVSRGGEVIRCGACAAPLDGWVVRESYPDPCPVTLHYTAVHHPGCRCGHSTGRAALLEALQTWGPHAWLAAMLGLGAYQILGLAR